LTRAQVERALIGLAPDVVRWSCKRWRQRTTDDPFSFGGLAAIDCEPGIDGIEEYATYFFPEPADLADYFDWRIDGIRAKRGRGSCLDGHQVTDWTYGRMVCWISRTGTKKAHIRWTDERTSTLGILDADDRDLVALELWWWEQVGSEL
jgi:hypothetical protein